LLSDVIVELQHLSRQLDALVGQFFPEHHAAYVAQYVLQTACAFCSFLLAVAKLLIANFGPALWSGRQGDNAMYEYLLQAIMLDELYAAVLYNLYQATFTTEEGAYANGVSRLNLASDVELFELFGAPRHLWLLSSTREHHLRTSEPDSPMKSPPVGSPIRSFDTSNMEIGFEALSPTSDGRMRPSVVAMSPHVAPSARTSVVPAVLASWHGKSAPQSMGLSPMAQALESRSGDLAGLRAALASAPLDSGRTVSPLAPKALLLDEIASTDNHADQSRPYAAAINCLKTLPAQRTPLAKLEVLSGVFLRMNQAVHTHLNGAVSLGGMDDVLPIFLFILVRAAVPHLRSELQYLFDFIDFDRVSGEKEIMLTTLRAGFFQLLNEAKA
jgi:hypothetical protein